MRLKIVLAQSGRCYDLVVMDGEDDRVAMVSDVNALEARLVTAVVALDQRLTDTLKPFATRAEVEKMIAEEGVSTRRYVDSAIERVTDMIKPLPARADVEAMIANEGANTPRHFDIMVERMTELMKQLADGVAHHSTVLDDHESRIQQLEK